VLIVLLGAIGDVVRALPLADRLRAGYPDAHLTWALEPAAAPLLAHHPAIDTRLIFDRAGGTRAFLRFLAAVRAEGADLAVDLQRHAKSGLVSFASRAPVRLFFHRLNSKELNWIWNTHTIAPVSGSGLKLAHYQRFGDWLELPSRPQRFGITLTAD
jgi:ADP-heptose:LPS heptosyltransferase